MPKYWLIRQRGLYWRPDSQGYTSLPGTAGLYSEEAASSIVRYQRDSPDTMVDLITFKEELQDRLKDIEKEKGMIEEKLKLIRQEEGIEE